MTVDEYRIFVVQTAEFTFFDNKDLFETFMTTEEKQLTEVLRNTEYINPRPQVSRIVQYSHVQVGSFQEIDFSMPMLQILLRIVDPKNRNIDRSYSQEEELMNLKILLQSTDVNMILKLFNSKNDLSDQERTLSKSNAIQWIMQLMIRMKSRLMIVPTFHKVTDIIGLLKQTMEYSTIPGIRYGISLSDKALVRDEKIVEIADRVFRQLVEA